MNIHAGLKRKNVLAGEIKVLTSRLASAARWIEGNEPPYNLKETLDELQEKTKELVSLKVKLSVASQRILPVILIMAEKKSLVTTLKGLDLSSGKQYEYREHLVVYKAAMTQKERDIIVSGVEKEIAELQDKLDEYNSSTDLDSITTDYSGSIK